MNSIERSEFSSTLKKPFPESAFDAEIVHKPLIRLVKIVNLGLCLNWTIFPISYQHLPTRGISVSSAAVYSIGLGRSEGDKT